MSDARSPRLSAADPQPAKPSQKPAQTRSSEDESERDDFLAEDDLLAFDREDCGLSDAAGPAVDESEHDWTDLADSTSEDEAGSWLDGGAEGASDLHVGQAITDGDEYGWTDGDVPDNGPEETDQAFDFGIAPDSETGHTARSGVDDDTAHELLGHTDVASLGPEPDMALRSRCVGRWRLMHSGAPQGSAVASCAAATQLAPGAPVFINLGGALWQLTREGALHRLLASLPTTARLVATPGTLAWIEENRLRMVHLEANRWAARHDYALPAADANQVLLEPGSRRLWVRAPGAGLFVSEDAGVGFRLALREPEVHAATTDASGAGLWALVGGSEADEPPRLVHSTDAGRTWSRSAMAELDMPLPAGLSLQAAGTSVLLKSAEELLLSANGGTSWRTCNGLDSTQPALLVHDRNGTAELYAVRARGRRTSLVHWRSANESHSEPAKVTELAGMEWRQGESLPITGLTRWSGPTWLLWTARGLLLVDAPDSSDEPNRAMTGTPLE